MLATNDVKLYEFRPVTPVIHGNIQHSTLHASHQLTLSKRRSLEMQATHYTIGAHTLVVLAELHLVAHQWLYFLFKLTLAKALEEIATSISKQARFNDEHTINICLYYVLFLIIIGLYIVKSGY